MPAWRMPEQQVDKPTTDRDYFERMSRVILVSGLNWRTLEKNARHQIRLLSLVEVEQVDEMAMARQLGLMPSDVADTIANR
ncbi:MAG TPA: hypothetical protein VH393_17440 [Ktedonobacterales bacterium]|jgi:3-methyladenine DNA glycosylase Tag